ncbi:hypothetical protein BpHYR1_025262 [Brachionus plicatilis]|uniref:Uncharacterized protein n=1 Tax=Brachionus plicatilis TaxID=10195 RepID=A0A3M7Q027_BRAPC|nr:hypothetical protein BpHYR1_025262 [Brachionus plicatilis]
MKQSETTAVSPSAEVCKICANKFRFIFNTFKVRAMQNFHTISRYGFRPHFWILPLLSQNLINRIYSIDTFSDRELNALYSELVILKKKIENFFEKNRGFDIGSFV